MNKQKSTYLLDPVQVLFSSKDEEVKKESVLIVEGYIKAFGESARKKAKDLNIPSKSAKDKLLAPCLVDPHSSLENPICSNIETIKSLRKKAVLGGYGQIALLPNGNSWRDSPEKLLGFHSHDNQTVIHIWGGFSIGGKGEELSPHKELIDFGAVGLAENDSIPPIKILKQGLLIGDFGKAPILVAPRDTIIQSSGMVREGIQTLRAGWIPDPICSETLPLSQLLELHRQHPDTSMRFMNISTGEGVDLIKNSKTQPLCTVCWWHLIKDSSNLSASDIFWRVSPSIGNPKDREKLIEGLSRNILTGIAVNAKALNEEEKLKPPNEQTPGLSGYHLILPLLWNELIIKSGWSINKLWNSLSFGPSKILNLPEEKVQVDSNRWLLYDPSKRWVQSQSKQASLAINEPFQGKEIIGKVIDCGLLN